jgi:acetate kinase
VTQVLVVNAGSTSTKLSVVAEDDTAVELGSLADSPATVVAVAHRFVHGGTDFRAPVVLDNAVLERLRGMIELAPLHNRAALERIDEARRLLPAVPHVAVFDTAFHATLPEDASAYAVPARWRDDWGIRRYGFHGLSLEWAASRVRVARLVVCHLGGGCSVTAVADGRSADTSMGFSPLDGVPMATRSGSIDPEILLYLLRTGRLGAGELEDALEHESGLLGLSGVSSRVEELDASETPGAELALSVFARRVAGAVAAMASSLRGIDALVFTGGVGEGSAAVRSRVCGRLGFLGVELDESLNGTATPDAEIAAPDSVVDVWVIHAREDAVAARAAREALAS